jgi:uncharacterized protein (TIGR02147 family)
MKIKIFDYIDFRDYLSQVLLHLRTTNKSLTYRKLSAEFGFKSPNFLLLLIQKKRKMSIETAQKITKILNLNKIEKEYFLLMVKSTLAKDVVDREMITKRMLQIQRNRHQKVIEPKIYELYENWYQVILYELLNLQQMPQTTAFLSSFFEEKVSEKQIAEAIEKLNELGLIEKRNNRWVNKQTNLKTGDFFSNTFVILFHKKMLELAEKSLNRHTGKERYLSALTLPISETSHQKIRELIEEFKIKALEICEETPDNNRVMQLNLQFFPITKVYDEKN